MARFDEMELIGEPDPRPAADPAGAIDLSSPGQTDAEIPAPLRPAPLLRRMLAFLTDLSLFVALALALSPILPLRASFLETLRFSWIPLSGLLAFLLLLSYFYFVGSWSIWGRTVGGTIFDTRVVSVAGTPVTLAAASRRWAATLLSLALAGLGFLPAILPRHRSLPDRMSETTVAAA